MIKLDTSKINTEGIADEIYDIDLDEYAANYGPKAPAPLQGAYDDLRAMKLLKGYKKGGK